MFHATSYITRLAALAAGWAGFHVVNRAWLDFQGIRFITCPLTNRPAVIALDARHAALTALIGRSRLRIRACSKWPGALYCPQQCLKTQSRRDWRTKT